VRRYILLAFIFSVALAALVFPAMRSSAEIGGDYIPVTQTLLPSNEPQTQAIDTGVREFPPTAAPKPFSHLLLRRDAFVPSGATLIIEVRAATDEQNWSPWSTVEPSDELAGPNDGPDVIWSQMFEVGAIARFWQIRTTTLPAPDGTQPVLRQIDVHTVETATGPTNPTPDQITPEALTSKSEPAVLASNGPSRPAVVSRTAWGSPDGQGSRVAPRYYAVNHLVVHHTADSSSLYPSETNWAARVRAIWAYHTITRGWGDIGYNYLIDPNGVVYEGRAGGDDAVAFHDTANYGSMGVSLLGTYSSSAPTSATQDLLVRLLAWKAAQRGIDPLGSSFYYGCTISNYCLPYNPGGIVVNIAGHRQVTPGHTTCPGDATMALMPGIRDRVRQLVIEGTPPAAQAELRGIQFPRTSIAAGEVLEVRFDIRNTGQIVISGQAPQVDLSSVDAFAGHTYFQNECFNGDPSGVSPIFPKEAGKLRVVLGTPSWDAENTNRCNGVTSNYPWRWGLNGDLQPGEERTIIGYVQFRTPGIYTLQAGLVQEYVGYMAQNVGTTQITVIPEQDAPELANYDSQLRPLAQIYQLGGPAEDVLARLTDATGVIRGPYIGSIPWSGEALDWGAGGPFGQNDRFMITQARSFMAATAGAYTFRLTSDDGSWLFVDGQPVISNPGLHPAQAATSTVQLSAGVHSLGVIAFESAGQAYVAYDYQVPGGQGFQSIPDSLSSQPNVDGNFSQPPLIALGSDDLGGSRVVSVRWSLNGGEWQENLGAIVRVGRLQQGAYTLRYQATDAASNQSVIRELRFGVGASAPKPAGSDFKIYLPELAR